MAIAIIDYGMGNIHSVSKALSLSGADTLVTDSPQDLKQCEKVVLPGVGAFDDAMARLKEAGLDDALKKAIAEEKPFLGICLGMQLLFNQSQEARIHKGLGIISGTVKRFDNSSLKVPHIGWNQLQNISSDCLLLQGVAQGSFVYFCHSYYPQPADASVAAAKCQYGPDFAAVIWQKNIYGVQFHPEKSQETGLKLLKNFVNLC